MVLSCPRRTRGGQRRCISANVAILAEIKRQRRSGASLAEIMKNIRQGRDGEFYTSNKIDFLATQAANYFERAIKGRGVLSSNYANLGLALRKLGRMAEAEKALLRSLEFDPQKVEALVNLGQLHKENKKHEDALEFFKKALAQNHRMIDVRLALSDIYFRLQELEELVGQCDFILEELNLPNNLILNDFKELSELYGLIGDELEKQGRKELSLLAFQVSFLISPSREVLERMVPLATSIGILTCCFEEMAEGLRLHGQDVTIFKVLGNHPSPI